MGELHRNRKAAFGRLFQLDQSGPSPIDEAKTHLSQLVDKAASGEDVVVSRDGKPIARITRLESRKPPIKFERDPSFLLPLDDVLAQLRAKVQ